MIGRVLKRGSNLAGLLYYLYGPGKACEHVNPHLGAGWRHPAELEPPLRPGGKRDFRRLTGLMEIPLAMLGDRAPAGPVWHCGCRTVPDQALQCRPEQSKKLEPRMHADRPCRFNRRGHHRLTQIAEAPPFFVNPRLIPLALYEKPKPGSPHRRRKSPG